MATYLTTDLCYWLCCPKGKIYAETGHCFCKFLLFFWGGDTAQILWLPTYLRERSGGCSLWRGIGHTCCFLRGMRKIWSSATEFNAVFRQLKGVALANDVVSILWLRDDSSHLWCNGWRRLCADRSATAVANKKLSYRRQTARHVCATHTMARLTLLKQDSSPHSDFSRFRSNRIRALVGATREIHGERWGPATWYEGVANLLKTRLAPTWVTVSNW